MFLPQSNQFNPDLEFLLFRWTGAKLYNITNPNMTKIIAPPIIIMCISIIIYLVIVGGFLGGIALVAWKGKEADYQKQASWS